MKSVENLTEGDYIAFGINSNGGEPNEIIVDCVSKVLEDRALIYFMGVTLRYEVKKENILAIGNNKSGEGKLKGWSGKYDILNQKEIDEILARR